MKLIDLTMSYGSDARYGYSLRTGNVPLSTPLGDGNAVVYQLACSSMCGTYLDFPGHIRETDNGMTACSADIASFYRMGASVVHLDRRSGTGAVTAEELSAAAGGVVKTDCLVINALGRREPLSIVERSVWFDRSAMDWISQTGCRVFVSDIYESTRGEGVFFKLFGDGIATVCMPAHLWQLPSRAVVTVMFCPVPGMTQLPCRIVAEIE